MVAVPAMSGYAASPGVGGGGGAGKVLLYIGIIMASIVLVCGGGATAIYYWIYSSVQTAAQSNRASLQMRMVGQALHTFHDAQGKLPAHAGIGPDNRPLLSWRVHLLPYIDGNYLYDQFHLDEPWDSPHNRSLISQMPQCYRIPGVELASGKTCIVAPVGAGTVFPRAGLLGVVDEKGVGPIDFGMVNDGMSNTIMVLVVPASKAVVWTQPDDFDLDKDSLGSLFEDGKPLLITAVDGTTHRLEPTIDHTKLRNLMLIDDGAMASFYDLDTRR